MTLTAWAYMWRTTAVHRWEMIGTPSDDSPPPFAAEVDLDDVQGIDDGTGPLVHRIYRTRIVGSDLSPAAITARIGADIDRIAPSGFATFQKLGRGGPLALSDEYIVRMPGPWDGPVRVVAVGPNAFRLATLTGHLEAGQIEFRAVRDQRGLEFIIESWARSGDRLSDLMYTHLRLAKEVQLHMWASVLERVVKLAQGTMSGGIVITTRRVDYQRSGEETAPTEGNRRTRRRLADLAQREVNFDASRMEAYTRANGWRVDDMVEPLGIEPSGPPARGGVWETARRLVVDYQLADPAAVRAVYRTDVPLDGRDMLLRIRFVGLRFTVGVRVAEVYDAERDLDGRTAHVYGWSYRTLEGHFEQGEMHYQVWKWLDTGAVEFRLHAVSKPADSGPWVLRTGFRLVGRMNQLRFYRQICRRARRLSEAESETQRVAKTGKER